MSQEPDTTVDARATDEADTALLSEPSPALKDRITGDVGWDDRLTGFTYNSGPGNSVTWMTSLKEVLSLLKHLDNFKLNNDDLADWIEGTMEDPELADAVRDASTTEAPRDRIIQLLEARIKQCEAED